jgi:hypothetical protein
MFKQFNRCARFEPPPSFDVTRDRLSSPAARGRIKEGGISLALFASFARDFPSLRSDLCCEKRPGIHHRRGAEGAERRALIKRFSELGELCVSAVKREPNFSPRRRGGHGGEIIKNSLCALSVSAVNIFYH